MLSSGNELKTHSSRLQLQEKPFQLLLVLVENPQRIVTREELRERMWGSETFVDYDRGINVAVKKVRDALGDSAENPKFIETIAKKGYRFLLPVEVAGPHVEGPQPILAANAPAVANVTSAPHRFGRTSVALSAMVAGAVLAGLAVWFLKVQPQHRHPAQIHSLAVLPLRNLSPDPGQEYFAEGITEDLVTNLARSLPLRVISRTSVMRYEGTTEPITQIARELGVEAIVEGAVARSGDRVTVTVQLVNAKEDRHLWAHKYDRQVGDLLEIETELSQQIANQVGSSLGLQREVKVPRSGPVGAQVYDLLLKGRYFWNKRTDEGVMRAAEYFRQAIDADPNYAPAYVGLADCYLFGQPPTAPPKVLAAKAKEMIKKALQVDDDLGEAHATLGLLAENFEWDWNEAEKEYKRAIELNPNYATAHQWYGGELCLRGNFDAALHELKLARDLDPLSLVIIKDTGDIYYVSHQYDRSIEYFRKTLEMDPNFVIAHINLAVVYAQQRQFSSALTELQKARQVEDSPYALSELGYVYALAGETQQAQRVLSQLKIVSGQRYVFPTGFAMVYAGLGNKDKALEWLEKGYREGGLLTGLKVDPHWDNLRDDPRFNNLMKRVGLAP